MATISLCMIVKNEEKTLGRCLESIKNIADEIIIVDTGSSDRTIEIAKKYDAKIFEFKWCNDFSAARNYSFSKASMDYVFWLDADDLLLEEDRVKLKDLKESINPEIDVVMMKYNIATDDNGYPLCTIYRERVLKRSMNFAWHDPVHEYIDFYGNVDKSDITVTHMRMHELTDRNLDIFEKMIAEGRELNARQCFFYARELYINNRIEDAIVYYNKFLDTDSELVSNYIDACMDLSQCYLSIGNQRKALKALIRSFEHDGPKAEICCRLGYYYKYAGDFVRAITWFKLAMNLKKPETTWGSVIHDYWGYIPCLETSICYSKQGNMEEATKYNDKALAFKPKDPIALYNKEQLYYQTRAEM